MLSYKYVVFALILTYVKHLYLYITQAYFAGLDSVYSLFWCPLYISCAQLSISALQGFAQTTPILLLSVTDRLLVWALIAILCVSSDKALTAL